MMEDKEYGILGEVLEEMRLCDNEQGVILDIEDVLPLMKVVIKEVNSRSNK